MTIENLNFPVGRIVGGHPSQAQVKTNFQTNQPVLTKEGQTIPEYRCEIAIPKNEFLAKILPLMVQEAATAFPINPATGQPRVSRDFSWKMIDGDSAEIPKRSKTPYNQREGYPGHYVLKISTEAFKPNVVKFVNGQWVQMQENEVKRGDYVAINANIKVHTNNDGGLYINPNLFEFVGYGAEIRSAAVDPATLLGDQRPALPPGASLTPVASSAPMQYQAPAGMPQAPMGMPAAPVQQYQQPQMSQAPQQLPDPAYDMVGMPQAPQMPQAPMQYPTNGLPTR